MPARLVYWLGFGLDRLLRQVLVNQQRILHRLDEIMAQNAEVLAYAKRIDAATDDIAADIKKILENPASGLSDEDRATLEASVSRLEALGAENV